MSTLAGSLLLFLAGTWSVYHCLTLWREAHPKPEPPMCPCPLCDQPVADVVAHLHEKHRGAGFMCLGCQRFVTAAESDAHWRLWHLPRPVGPEDRADWTVR